MVGALFASAACTAYWPAANLQCLEAGSVDSMLCYCARPEFCSTFNCTLLLLLLHPASVLSVRML
jgi:hypothetical protein